MRQKKSEPDIVEIFENDTIYLATIEIKQAGAELGQAQYKIC